MELDSTAYGLAVKMKNEGHTQAQIGEALTKKGYKTAKGNDVNQTAVSKLLLKTSTRRRVRKIVKNTSKRFISDIKEVMDAQLSPHLKEKFIRQMVGGAEFTA